MIVRHASRLRLLFSLVFRVLLVGAFAVAATSEELRDVVGATHSQGGYTFSTYHTGGNNDYLNEGAAELTELGTRVIKVWFHPNAQAFYPFTRPGYGFISQSDTDNRLVALAQSTQYSTLFSNSNFTTYIMVILPNNTNNEHVFLDGMTAAESDQERRAMKNLSAHLLATYGNTTKTFVLQNWEGDHMLRGCCGGTIPVPPDQQAAILGMRDWINARQTGVTEARALYPNATAKVVHAAEVNLVYGAATGNPDGATMVNDVVPFTNCDLYSYSIWDTTGIPANLTTALDYLQTKAPDSTIYGKFNIYIGEYGSGENEAHAGDGVAQKELIRRYTETAIGWGVRYLVYWQTYDNYNDAVSGSPNPPNSAFSGIWLVRPDGTHAPVYDYFHSLMSQSFTHAGLRSSGGYYVSAINAGGGDVDVHDILLRWWEYLTLIDPNGGTLMHGDTINILSQNGHFFRAINGGGDTVDARATLAFWWEEQTIHKTSGTGQISMGTEVAIKAYLGQYFVAEEGGGAQLNANRTALGAWEQFTLVDWLCPDVITPQVTSFPTSGGNSSIALTGGTICSWAASTAASWITITNGAGVGSGSVTFTVASNSGPARTASIVIRGTPVAITQSAGSPLQAPTGLTATRQTTTSALISWNTIPGATAYEVFRGTTPNNFSILSSNATTPLNDGGLAPGITYLYKVRALNGEQSSAFSNLDLTTTVLFSTDPIVPGGTIALAAHVTELRQAVNAVRAAAGLGPGTYTNNPVVTGATLIKAIHIAELRTQLSAALVDSGFSAPSFTDPTLTAGQTTVKAVHVQDLRNATK